MLARDRALVEGVCASLEVDLGPGLIVLLTNQRIYAPCWTVRGGWVVATVAGQPAAAYPAEIVKAWLCAAEPNQGATCVPAPQPVDRLELAVGDRIRITDALVAAFADHPEAPPTVAALARGSKGEIVITLDAPETIARLRG